MAFPVVMYGCKSWTLKKAECQRTDASELWCWKRLFESCLDSKEIQPVHPKGNQSWIFIGRTDAKAETTILWPPEVKNLLIGKDSCWEGLKVGGEGDDWACDGWMASLTLWKWVWVSSGSWWWTGKPGMQEAMGVTESQTQLSHWTETGNLPSKPKTFITKTCVRQGSRGSQIALISLLFDSLSTFPRTFLPLGGSTFPSKSLHRNLKCWNVTGEIWVLHEMVHLKPGAAITKKLSGNVESLS